MKKMHIRINRDGKTSLEVEGGNGSDCLEFTKLVEKAVGDVEDRVYKEEYEQADTIHLTQTLNESEFL